MLGWLFGGKPKSRVGIDLGVSAIKIVELKKEEERLQLRNYALLWPKNESSAWLGDLTDEETAKILRSLFSQAKIETRYVNISLPINKTFSTIVEFPEMSEEELAAAVPFEAKKYIPVPLDEVVLDWSVVGRTAILSKAAEKGADIRPAAGAMALAGGRGAVGNSQTGQTNVQSEFAAGQPTQLQVLLVAVPKEIINRLTSIARMAHLHIGSLEQESFSLARCLVGNDQKSFLLADLGRRSCDIVIVDEGFVRLSHNLETVNKESLLMEIDRLVNIFRTKYNKNIGSCFLTGGRANEKETFEFLSKKLKVPVIKGNSFARLGYPAELKIVLEGLGPQLSVAVGLAMREG